MHNPFTIIEERFDRMEALLNQVLACGSSSIESTQKVETKDSSLVDADQLASHLGISKSTIMRHVRNDKFPYYKPGKSCLFKISEVEHAISSLTPVKRNKKGGSR